MPAAAESLKDWSPRPPMSNTKTDRDVSHLGHRGVVRLFLVVVVVVVLVGVVVVVLVGVVEVLVNVIFVRDRHELGLRLGSGRFGLGDGLGFLVVPARRGE